MVRSYLFYIFVLTLTLTLTDKEFETLKDTRKKLSHFLASTQHTHKTYSELTNGNTDYICKNNINIIPNRMNSTVIETEIKQLKLVNEHTNGVFMNEIISQTETQVNNAKELASTVTPIILAKTWRSVKISNKTSSNNRLQRQHVPDKKTGYTNLRDFRDDNRPYQKSR